MKWYYYSARSTDAERKRSEPSGEQDVEEAKEDSRQ